MKQGVVAALLLAGVSLGSSAQPAQDNPVLEVGTSRGERCGKSSSFEVDLKNRSDQSIALRVCVERSDVSDERKRWSCGLNSRLKPQQTMNSFTCAGTGRYHYWWGRPGYGNVYPDPGEPSGPAWSARIKCPDDSKVLYQFEVSHPAVTKVRTSRGVNITVRNRKVKGEDRWIIDYNHLGELVCGSSLSEGSAIDRLNRYIKREFEKAYLHDCMEKGHSKEHCRSQMHYRRNVGPGVRG